MGNGLQRIVFALLTIMVLALGLKTCPVAIMGNDFSLVPGDLGDARFNNYILEHVHRWMQGEEERLWDVPMMYPHKNVLALSDNHLGTAWIYSIARSIGYERESAFQLWLLAMFILNYFGAFFAARVWTKNSVIPIVAAYIFAFGIYSIAHINHVQVFAKAFLPLGIAMFWQWLSSGRIRWFFASLICLVAQLYCTMYLGMYLLMGFLVLTIVFLFLGKRETWNKLLSLRSSLLYMIGGSLLASACLYPLLEPYLAIAGSVDAKPYSQILSTLPRPRSYIFSHPVASSWHSLTYLYRDLPVYWLQMNFLGATVWTGLLVSLFFFFRSPRKEIRNAFGLSVISLLLFFLLTTNFGGESFYHLIYQLPGYSALRSMDRIVHLSIVFFMIPSILLLDKFLSTRPRASWALVLIPVAFLDNAIMPNQVHRFEKQEGKNLTKRMTQRFKNADLSDKKAICYAPIYPVTYDEDHGMNLLRENLSAMIAAQELNVSLVNGYSGSQPYNFNELFSSPSKKALREWMAYHEQKEKDVLWFTNVDVPVRYEVAVHWKTSTGLGISFNESSTMVRPKDIPLSTYKLLVLQKTKKIALMNDQGKFMSADLPGGHRIHSDVNELGDMGMFTWLTNDSVSGTLKTYANEYVSIDDSGILVSRSLPSDSLAQLFRIERIDQGVRVPQ